MPKIKGSRMWKPMIKGLTLPQWAIVALILMPVALALWLKDTIKGEAINVKNQRE